MKKIPSAGFSTAQGAGLILAAVVVAAAAFFAAYAWQHRQVTTLQARVSSLDTQLGGANTRVADLTARLNQACPSQAQPGQSQPSGCAASSYTSDQGVAVVAYSPAKNAKISSPLAVIGEVPGSWSFEAQFPVRLKDSHGSVIAQATGHVLGNWQTSQLVPFSAQLIFAAAGPGSGTLILEKDNPSGLSQNADAVSIPVQW